MIKRELYTTTSHKSEINNKTFKILSIDGGGSRILYSLYVLNEIEKKYCKEETTLCHYFNMISGTSIGGAIAILISKGYTIQKIIDIVEDNVKSIFPSGNFITNMYYSIWQILGCKYSNKALLNLLLKYVGNESFNTTNYVNHLCIPSYNVKNNYICVFKNYDNEDDICTKDVIMATCAAPTYFPSYVVDGDYYIDGAIWCNNPSLVALSESYKFIDKEKYTHSAILSIGNIVSIEKVIPRSKYFWNIFRVTTLINTILDSSEHALNVFMRNVCNMTYNIYVRISHKEIISPELDDTTQHTLQDLKENGIHDGIKIVEECKENLNVKPFFMDVIDM